ncbi:MAG TPA: AraC family transcriptional regulator [Bryobacteraceae bacterium]|nr:AraC family transcriptional regulator [Bryobacteraceae bacterium]
MRPTLYLERIPAPPLAAFVRSIWYCESAPRGHALERVLPNGAPQLIVNLKADRTRTYRPELGFACQAASGTVLSGVQSRYCVIDTAETECVLGVAFHAGGTVPFFRVPAHELRDTSAPLDLFWGRGAADLRTQLLEASGPQARLAAMERALAASRKLAEPHAAVAFALEAFRRRPDQASMAAVAGKIGLSPKRFIERFKATVGVPPKHYCRILRFQRALAAAARGDAVDWTRIAVDCGYFDQAHFIHDFRAFAGITPTAYQSARTEFQNHVKFVQSAAAAL